VTTDSVSFFVRIDRHVRGPFSREVLASMFDRGRITSDTAISSDRNSWFELRDLGEPFANGNAPLADTSATPDYSQSNADQFFCTINGETHGPLSLDVLQRLVGSGQLEPNDQVWQQGQPDWKAAQNVSGLKFVSQPEQARSWIRAHPALFASVAFILIALLTLPTYYVLASAAARKAERLAKEQQRKETEQREREETDLKEKIAREERQHAEQIDLLKMQHEEQMQLLRTRSK
jgi:hypothetical protein